MDLILEGLVCIWWTCGLYSNSLDVFFCLILCYTYSFAMFHSMLCLFHRQLGLKWKILSLDKHVMPKAVNINSPNPVLLCCIYNEVGKCLALGISSFLLLHPYANTPVFLNLSTTSGEKLCTLQHV